MESVLSQDPGQEQMQIEVVDGCSTVDDPEELVHEIGRGRIQFFRKSKNEGGTADFNTCIQRSVGQFVHILHADDYVLPGFYDQLRQQIERRPGLALYATRCFFVDEDSIITLVTDRLRELEEGSHNVSSFAMGTPLQFAGVVVRRSFFEENRGFLGSLVHAADWEMWTRAIALGGGCHTANVLACYRYFSGSGTGRLQRTGENIRDLQRLSRYLEQRIPDFDKVRFRDKLIRMAGEQTARFRALGDRESEATNWELWRELMGLKRRAASYIAARLAGVGDRINQLCR
jgi:glycosyltransferase involved in cell wall biosynthesis